MNFSRRDFLKTAVIAAGGSAAAAIPSCSLFSTRPPFDIIVKNGLLIDGTNSPGVKIDIGIRDGRILEIADLSGKEAGLVLNAENRIVSPGFIDIHTHSDTGLMINPKGESKIRQGVTTELAGNCGSSPAPISAERFKSRIEYFKEEYGIDLNWTDFNSFLETAGSNPFGHNLCFLAGHGTIRTYVMGEEGRKPSKQELEKMAAVARESVEQGAMGFSTGLEYTPGSFAETGELIAIAKEVSKAGGIYSTHMRNEDKTVEEAVEEALTVARESGISLQIAHLKSSGRPNWHKIDKIIDKIEKAREEGVNVHFDRYPYIAYSTSLSALFPLWAREGGNEKFMNRLKDKTLLPKIREEVENKISMIDSWDAILISGVRSDSNRDYQGKTILKIAESTGENPYDLAHRLMVEEEGHVGMCGFAMSEENLKIVLKHKLCMPASDGNSLAPYGVLGKGSPHPRSYGTFPRFIRKYCIDEKICSIEEGIHKITGLPAQKLKFSDRGILKKGNWADVTVFDPATIKDTAEFGNSHKYPEGIDYVIVNGKVAVDKKKRTENLSGQIIRNG